MFLLPKNYSFRLMRDKKFQQIARSAISKPVKKGIEAIAQSQRSLPKKTDGDKRAFFKVAGIAGAGLLASQLLPHKAEALIMGSTPAANVVGVKNSSDARIDPATETTLAAIKTQTDKFTFSGSNLLTESSGGGGGAVTVNDTTDTQINPATDDSAMLLRRLVKQSDSLAVVDSAQRQKVTVDSFTAGLALPTVTAVGTVTTVTTVTTCSTVTSVTAVASVTALGGVDGRYLFIDTARNASANGIRNSLVFS